MNHQQLSQRIPNMKANRDQYDQKDDNQSQGSMSEQRLSSSQSIRNGPFSNMKRIPVPQHDGQQFDIQTPPIKYSNCQNKIFTKPFMKEQNNKSQAQYISQQNNLFQQNQQQPQIKKMNQSSDSLRFEQQIIQQPQQYPVQNIQSSNQQQYYSNFVQNEQFKDLNNKQVSIDVSMNEASNQQLNQLNSVINSLNGQEDIQINIQSPNQQLLSSFQQINQQYPNQLQFSQLQQDNNVTSLQFDNSTKRNRLNQNDSIIQIHPQEQNNVPKELKTIIFEWKCMKELEKEAENHDIDIQLDIKNFQYQLVNNDNGLSQRQFDIYQNQFEEILQNFIILTHQCQYQEEAILKKQILSKPNIMNILLKQFNIQSDQYLDIDIMSNYQIRQTRKCLKDILKFYFNQNFLIVTLLDYDIQIFQVSIKQLQKKLNGFIQNLIIHHQDESQIIHVDNLLDLNSIRLQIQQINIDNIYVQILNPNYDYAQGKNYYQIIYNIWLLKQEQHDMINNRLQDLKHNVQQIINPIIQLKIELQEQILIWNLYLELKYNYQQIKVEKQNNHIFIQFIAEKEDNYKNKREIQKQLQDLKYSSFVYNLDQPILSILKQFQIKKIFEKELQAIKLNQQIAYLQIFDIDNQSQIKFEAIYSGHSREFIKMQLQDNIIKKIKIEIVDINFVKIFEYQKKSKEQYEQIYQCYININNNQTTYVTLIENVVNIQKSIQEYKDFLDMKISIIKKKLENNLLMEKVQQILRNDKSFDIKLNITYNEDDNIIELRGPQHIVDANIAKLDDIIFDEAQKIKTKKIQLNTKIWNYFNNKHLLSDFLKQNKCSFNVMGEQENGSNGQNRAILKFNNQVLILRQGDIVQQKCDAIVNSCNEQMNFGNMNLLNGVANKILEYFGPQFRNHTESLIKRQGNFNGADLYQVPNFTTIKNIISIPTIHYSKADTNIDQFQRHIQSIFNIANKHQLKSLVIPILGGGSAGYYFETVSNLILNEVIVQMQNTKHIENVVIIENQQSKIEILVNILKSLLNSPKIRQIKYQWQWYDDDGWKDYDDIEIIKKIDESYELFQLDNYNNQIEIVFPYTKQPGTHLVDLNLMTVTDMKTNQIQKITLINQARSQQYAFNGDTVDPALSEFLELQKLRNQNKFQIFLKKYKIAFLKDIIIQINQQTNFQREVRFQIYRKQQIQQSKCPINCKFDFNEYQVNSSLINAQEQVDIIIKSYEQGNLNKAKQFIDDLIQKKTTTLKWQVINLNDQQCMEVEQFIIDKSIYHKGQMNYGDIIEIYCFKSKAKKLTEYFETLKMKQIYPQTWVNQNNNMIKVQLSKNEEEYKKVSQHFFNSYITGKIFQINRIQNRVIYENFQDEKRKLIKLRQSQGQQLSQIELERYVWHGVSGQHPQIIYSGLKEAFDVTYSQVFLFIRIFKKSNCLWGRGIYFAENSSYSKSYSYTLKPQDSQQYQGKKIFLLCLVATGKVSVLNPDNSILRPPDGYDCVQGYTQGSNIFVLYGMDVRRAYPAFEVIYE